MQDFPSAGFLCRIMGPEGVVFEGQSVGVCVPSTRGPYQILAEHAPFVQVLGAGVLEVFCPVQGVAEEALAASGTPHVQVRTFYIESGLAWIESQGVVLCRVEGLEVGGVGLRTAEA